jgi:hypothetical protein
MLLANSVASEDFNHEMYRATRLSTNERMLVDWPDRTQAGRNEVARFGLGSSN